MPSRYRAVALALVTLIGTPNAVWAFGGVGGCNSLPEYYRALGVLQGHMESACAMSVEDARRILTAYGYPLPAPQTIHPARSPGRRLHPR